MAGGGSGKKVGGRLEVRKVKTTSRYQVTCTTWTIEQKGRREEERKGGVAEECKKGGNCLFSDFLFHSYYVHADSQLFMFIFGALH